MGVREDRLRAENDAMKNFRSQVISLRTLGNTNPPDLYRITYNLKSVVGFTKKNKPQYHKGFEVEVKFPLDFPRASPEVRMISKPWPLHPNIFRDGRFCLEGTNSDNKTQGWIPGIGVPLEAICLMVGKIIAFQEVNLNSPARNIPELMGWIKGNLNIINIATVTNPVDPSPIRLPDIEDAVRWGSESPPPPKPRIKW